MRKMRQKLRFTTLAAAVVAAVIAAPAVGQSTTADQRVYGAIQSLDHGKRFIDTVSVNTAELARARAVGEMPESEARSTPLREYTVTPAKAAVIDARSPASVPGAAPRDEARAPAIVNAAGSASIRTTTLPLMSDAARAAEHMKYEAEKRRRSRDTVAPVAAAPVNARGVEPVRAEVEARFRPVEDARASIIWSAAEAPARAHSASDEALIRLGLSDRQ